MNQLNSPTVQPVPSTATTVDQQLLDNPNNNPPETATRDNIATVDLLEDVLSGRFRSDDLPEQYRLNVHVADKKVSLPDTDILQFFWSEDVDSPCMVCGVPFEADPPLRTISLESISVSKGHTYAISIRIHNRHSRCIKDKTTTYIPISHVWHNSVALAHDTHQSTPQAAHDVRNTVVRVLLAITTHTSLRGSEIWHDYMSIPQWQLSHQQQLLLKLREIYAYPSYIVVHLDDASLSWFDSIQAPEPTESSIHAFSNLVSCKWFSRMWVVLEYSASRKAFGLVANWTVTPKPLSELVKTPCENYWKTNARDLPHDITSERYTDMYSTLYQISPWGKVEPNCLGEVLHMISSKNCRAYRDRFSAALGLIYSVGPNDEVAGKGTVQQLPTDQFDVCKWLATKRLREGDYSPLLLGRSPDEIPKSPYWVTAHSNMGNYTWDFGKQKNAPTYPDILQRINGESGSESVEPQLELFGQILDAREIRGSLPDFEDVLAEIVQLSGADARVLVGTLASIYPPYYMRDAWQVPEDTLSQIHTSLRDYIEAQQQQGHNRRKQICTKIAEILQLNVARRPGVKHTIRLHRRVRDREFVCKVRCPTCGLVYLIRLYMWERPGEHAYLWRIPGLSYEYSLPNGVGLVVEEGRVVGKMRYGVKGCGCEGVERVRLL